MKAKGFELKSHWDKTVWEVELLDELCKEDGYNVYRAYTTTTCRTMDGKYFPNVANTLEICVKEQS